MLPCLIDVPPLAVDEQTRFDAFQQIHASRTQWHLHSFRCHQRIHGKDGCCSYCPRPLKESGNPIVFEPSFLDEHYELVSYTIQDYDADTISSNDKPMSTKEENVSCNFTQDHDALSLFKDIVLIRKLSIGIHNIEFLSNYLQLSLKVK
jgi:hypothetical protein